jgi:hypothetical protein
MKMKIYFFAVISTVFAVPVTGSVQLPAPSQVPLKNNAKPKIDNTNLMILLKEKNKILNLIMLDQQRRKKIRNSWSNMKAAYFFE